MDSNENYGRNSTLKIIAAYGPVLRKNSKFHNYCNFWQIVKTVTACMIMIPSMKFGRIGWKLGEDQSFKNCKIGNFFQSAPYDPKPKSRNRASKVPSICALQDPESQIFVCFALRSSVFEIFHIIFLGFPIDYHIRISKWHKIFKTWPIAKKSDSLYSTMVAKDLIKFGWHQVKTVGEAFWNVQPHMVLCWEKVQSPIKFSIFGRSSKK